MRDDRSPPFSGLWLTQDNLSDVIAKEVSACLNPLLLFPCRRIPISLSQ